jgi:hypothetical protein
MGAVGVVEGYEETLACLENNDTIHTLDELGWVNTGGGP